MDNLDYPYIPVYTMLYSLPNIMTIGSTTATTVVPRVLATPNLTSSSTDRPSND